MAGRGRAAATPTSTAIRVFGAEPGHDVAQSPPGQSLFAAYPQRDQFAGADMTILGSVEGTGRPGSVRPEPAPGTSADAVAMTQRGAFDLPVTAYDVRVEIGYGGAARRGDVVTVLVPGNATYPEDDAGAVLIPGQRYLLPLSAGSIPAGSWYTRGVPAGYAVGAGADPMVEVLAKDAEQKSTRTQQYPGGHLRDFLRKVGLASGG